MRRNNLLSTAAARLLQFVFVGSMLVAASVYAGAQTRASDVNTPAPSSTQTTQVNIADADEEFELNIDERRISEKEFHAETAVETDGARGVQLGVGVALRAQDIEVLLQGVRGHVRFRASLAPVLRLLEARRAVSTQIPQP